MCTPDPYAGQVREALVTIAGCRGAEESVDQMLFRVARLSGIDLVRVQGYWRRDIQRVPYGEGLRIFAAAARAKAQADRAAQAVRDAEAARHFVADRISTDENPDLAAVASAVRTHRRLGEILATRLPSGGLIADHALGLQLIDRDPIRVFAGTKLAIDHQSALGRSVRRAPCMDAAEPLVAQVHAVAGGADVLAFRCRGRAGASVLDFPVATFADPDAPRDRVWRVIPDWTEAAA